MEERPCAILLKFPGTNCDAETARALEEVFTERLGEHAAVIGHHWEQAQKPSLAWRWRRLAALRVTRIQPVDMFPHTDHIETVVTLARG